jgi:chromosome segregation ATPase
MFVSISICLFYSFQQILDKEGEAFEVIPDTQFSVARTANKDNSSHYEVDGKRRVFKDVAKLLRKKGIDLDHNRFLILQGEVEQIAMMKPIGQNENDTGMLEFLEDIVGSSRFKVGLLQYFDMHHYNLGGIQQLHGPNILPTFDHPPFSSG